MKQPPSNPSPRPHSHIRTSFPRSCPLPEPAPSHVLPENPAPPPPPHRLHLASALRVSPPHRVTPRSHAASPASLQAAPGQPPPSSISVVSEPAPQAQKCPAGGRVGAGQGLAPDQDFWPCPGFTRDALTSPQGLFVRSDLALKPVLDAPAHSPSGRPPRGPHPTAEFVR